MPSETASPTGDEATAIPSAAPGEAAAPVPSGPSRPLVARLVRGFAMFWWDFLVGDTPEFFVGVLVLIGVVLLLVRAASLNALAVGLFPALVVVLLTASVLQAKRSKR